MARRAPSLSPSPDYALARDIDSQYDEVKIVADNIANIIAAAGVSISLEEFNSYKPTFDSVMAMRPELDSIFADKDKLDSLFNDKAVLDSLYADKATLDSLYASINAINAVNNNLSGINTVSTNIADVNVVAANETDVTSVATNLAKGVDSEILNAEANASIASQKATEASTSADSASADAVQTAADRVQTSNDAAAANSAKTAAETAQGLSESARDAANTSATNAANSATAASNSANAASASESNAAVSESNALTSANNAAASADFVDDLVLGAKASDPTTDNDGNPLQIGAIYYSTSSNPKQLKIWDGTAWQTAVFNASGTVTSFNGRDGAVTLSAADINSALGFTAVELTKTNVDVLGVDANTVTGNTVETSVPAGAVFTDTTYGAVTTTVDGLMIAFDKTKLDGVETNANNYVHPTNDGNLHVPATGTTNSGKVLTAGSTAGSMSWTTLTKIDVGLDNVDNTADIDKPISTATQTALDSKLDATAKAVDSDKLDGLDSTQFLRKDQNEITSTTLTTLSFISSNTETHSTTNGAVRLTGISGAIVLDDDGSKRISWNDGVGDFQLRGGHRTDGTNEVYVGNHGAARIRLDQDTTDGGIYLSTAVMGTDGATVAWVSELKIDTTGIYYNDQPIVSGDITASKVANGYQKLPSGLIIQWGTLDITPTATSYTLPIAYPTAHLMIIGQGAGSVKAGGVVNFAPNGLSQFNAGTQYTVFESVSYISIGY